MTSILWRRLDVPGHDACRLRSRAGGWTIEGAAVFREDDAPCRLGYAIDCDREWRTLQADVRGWIGERTLEYEVARTPDGAWTLNGAAVRLAGACSDLDLGFTPASNLTQLRRLALRVGQAADVDVAWLDAAAGTLDVLRQTYSRRSDTTYWYEAPRFEYSALLEVTPEGFVRRYPGLWEAEAP
jgi:uncharacterized protein